jgi:hypothetical protein
MPDLILKVYGTIRYSVNDARVVCSYRFTYKTVPVHAMKACGRSKLQIHSFLTPVNVCIHTHTHTHATRMEYVCVGVYIYIYGVCIIYIWRGAARFTPRPLLSRAKGPLYQLNKELGGAES